MNITKKEIKRQLDGNSKLWNKVATVEGITVARVCWHTKQYKIVDSGATFEDVSDRAYKPIQSFYYQSDLINYIYKFINKIT